MDQLQQQTHWSIVNVFIFLHNCDKSVQNATHLQSGTIKKTSAHRRNHSRRSPKTCRCLERHHQMATFSTITNIVCQKTSLLKNLRNNLALVLMCNILTYIFRSVDLLMTCTRWGTSLKVTSCSCCKLKCRSWTTTWFGTV